MNRHPLSAPGSYYVVCNRCLLHELCVHEAPNNFVMSEQSEAGWCAYVYKQPGNEIEEKQCQSAKLACPMAAVRDDG